MNISTKYLNEHEWQAHAFPGHLYTLDTLKKTSTVYLIAKRALDISGSALILLLFGTWLLPLLALLIRLESMGSPMFSQERTGKNGKTFTCYKLRTMYLNDVADLKQATHDDQRITRLGNFLRLSSLDEFPQFINVLLGHMSLVGPRPHMLYHTETYGKLIHGYPLRHAVKPGITGLAQIRGFRGPTSELRDMEKRVNADLYYIAHQNLSMDLRIIWATAHEIISSLKRP